MTGRYPIEPLLHICRARYRPPNEPHIRHGDASILHNVLSERFHISHIHRWLRHGDLTERDADRAATELGLHPTAIWPTWLDE